MLTPLFLYVKYEVVNEHRTRNIFNNTNLKIISVSIFSIYIFNFIINFSEKYLMYESEFKLFTIILLVLITIFVYISVSLLTKTFKYSDIKLKY